MKFLADAGISMSTVQAVRDSGYEVIHLREQGLQRFPDPEVIRKARDEGRIILTFDLDFSDLLALGVMRSPSIIIFRLHDETPACVNSRLLEVLHDRNTELENGALIIVEDNRYRMRRLPIEE